MLHDLKRLLLPCSLLCICHCAGPLLSADESTEKEHLANGQQHAKPAPQPAPLITISNETTRISGPIADDGYVDYLAALRAKCKAGVTPENNVVVSLWQAIGPYGELAGDDELQKKYFKEMGIEPLPLAGDYYVPIRDAARKHLGKEAAEPEIHELATRLRDKLAELTDGPWTAMDDSLLAKWIEVNEKPLGVAVAGIMSRDQYYAPLLGGGEDDEFSGSVVAVLLPTAQQSREIARFLFLRGAMFRLGKKDVDGALKDLLACHRLARHYSKAPTLIEALVCYAIEGMACARDASVAHHAKLTAKQVRWYQDELGKMPPPPSIARCIDVCERFMYLDLAVALARKGPGAMRVLGGLAGGDEDDGPLDPVAKILFRAAIDWDEPMRMGNQFYDRMVESTRLETYKERVAAGEKISADLKKLTESAKDFSGLAMSIFSIKSARKRLGHKMGAILCAMIMPAVTAASAAEDRTTMQVELSQLAFALSAYHGENGKYPDKLADLAPAYVKAIPADHFSGDPLIYRRDEKGYLLYSVGRNLQDDGGASLSSPNPDISVRSPAYPKEDN